MDDIERLGASIHRRIVAEREAARRESDYQRGRREALEEAAKVCEEAVYNERPASPLHAAAIRALISKEQ